LENGAQISCTCLLVKVSDEQRGNLEVRERRSRSNR